MGSLGRHSAMDGKSLTWLPAEWGLRSFVDNEGDGASGGKQLLLMSCAAGGFARSLSVLPIESRCSRHRQSCRHRSVLQSKSRLLASIRQCGGHGQSTTDGSTITVSPDGYAYQADDSSGGVHGCRQLPNGASCWSRDCFATT